MSPPSLSLRLRQNNRPYGYRGLKIFTSLKLRFQDFQRTSLHWKNDIDSLDQTNYTGLAVTNIKDILIKATETKKIPGGKDKGNDNRHNQPPPLLGLSIAQKENIGGKEFIFFIQPFQLNHNFYTQSDDTKTRQKIHIKTVDGLVKTIPQPQFYMVGLVDDSRFRKESIAISSTLSAFIFVILFFGILSWPTVKLNFIGIREQITRGDLRFLLISLFITSGFIVIFFMSILTMELMEKKLDQKSVAIGKEISKDFEEYITRVIKEFDKYKATVFNDENYTANLSAYENKKISPQSTDLTPEKFFPEQRDIFTVNEKGILFKNLLFFVEEFDTTYTLNIKNRDYFKKVIKGEAWHEQSNRVYLQRIRNYSDGFKSTQAGSRYFCESLFWASQPKQAAKT